MRYIAYGLASLVAVFVLAFTTGYLPRDATASHKESNDTKNVLQMEQRLPKQEIPDEVYR
jgi:hypothetical protein